MRGNWYVTYDEVSFWERVSDSDLRQRRDINEALGQEELLQTDLVSIGRQIDKLRSMVAELSVTNSVMLKMLGESGQLDLKVLKYRVEAALDALADPGPSVESTVLCVRCSARVPLSHTTVTEHGAVCDACYER